MEQLEEAYVDKELRNAYNKGHRYLILRFELQLREFVTSNNQQFFFEYLDSFQRKVLHRLCYRYHLGKEVRQQTEDKAGMTISKAEEPRRMYQWLKLRPQKTVIDIIECRKYQESGEGKSEATKPKKVLLRSKNTPPAMETYKPQVTQKQYEVPTAMEIPKIIEPEPEPPKKVIYGNSVNAVFENQYEYDPDYDRNDYAGQNYLPMMYHPMMYMQYGQFGMPLMQVPQPPTPQQLIQQQTAKSRAKYSQPPPFQPQHKRKPQYRRREQQYPLPSEHTTTAQYKFNLDESDFPSL